MDSDVKVALVSLLVTLLIISAVAGCAWLLTEPNTRMKRADVEAAAQCTDLGYQTSEKEHEVYYCMTCGLEPTVLRLGTVDELDAEYQEAHR